MAAEAPAAGPAALTRSGYLGRWALAGLLLPAVCGALSWICFEARLGMLFDALANIAMFAAPLWPFVLKTFAAREANGVQPYAVAAGVVVFNAALYAAVGSLHWRLRAQPRVNQLLWLTVVILVGFALLKYVALIWAFAA